MYVLNENIRNYENACVRRVGYSFCDAYVLELMHMRVGSVVSQVLALYTRRAKLGVGNRISQDAALQVEVGSFPHSG